MTALVVAACGSSRAPVTTASVTSAAAPSAGEAGSAPGAVSARAVPEADWPTFGFDAQRTGSGPAATGITAADLRSLSLRRVTIDGIADSAAIELHGLAVGGTSRDVAVVTTSYGRTIAIDARTGRRLWEFAPAGVNSTPGNPQVTTASPVADPDRRYVYSASPNGVIHKLALATGRPLWATRITFDAAHEKIASSLAVDGADVVAVTGGYIGDVPPYDGHVVTLTRAGGRIVHVWNSECSDRHRLIRASSCSVTNTRGDNAIWGRAGAVIEPGSGRLLVATGNGPFNGSTNWGDSVLELSPDAATLLHNWTPVNQAQLSSSDADVGSTSPALLPVVGGRRLAVQGGKDGTLHLLDLDRLDGTTGGAGRRLGGELSETSSPGGGQVLTAPGVWRRGGAVYVFVGDDSGITAYRLQDPAAPRLAVVWSSPTGATSPVIAGGLLYTYDPSGSIEIRRPLSSTVLRSLPAAGGHWNSPIVAGGRIIEPTGAYGTSASLSEIDIYHLPGR